MENRKKILMKLFVSTLYLSAFTFGGGYVIVTLMKKKFVDEYHWIEENEMLDLVAIAQSAPGPIAVNGAIVVGYKLAGMTGVVTAIIGTIIPPFLIISLISVCYNVFRDNFIVSQMLSGMQAGVGAVIASVTYEMGAGIVHGKNAVSMCIMAAAFLASCVFHVNVVFVVIACGLIGALRTLAAERSAKNDLSPAFLKFSADRHVQLRRRVCGNAADPGTGRDCPSLAFDGGIHGSDHDLPDDTGTHRRQFRNLCRNKDCGNRRRPRGHLRMHPAVLHHRDLYRQTILKIQKSGTLTGDLKLPASRGRRFDRLCRDLDPHHRVLVQSGSGRPREHKLASCDDLRCLRCPASEV